MRVSDYLLLGLLLAAAVACFRATRPTLQRLATVCSVAATIVGAVIFMGGRWQALPALLAAALLLMTAVLASRSSNRRWPLVALVFSIVLGALTATLSWMLPAQDLPEPGGPYAIGTTVFELADPSRPMNPFTPDSATRRIQIRAWYPAEVASSQPVRRYFEGDEAEIFGAGFGRIMGLPGFFWNQLQLTRTHSHVDAPIASQGGPYPVVVFNHGYWSYPTQNTVLMEYLASRGYVLFSVSHPYDSAGVRFADGTYIGIPPERPQRVIGDEMKQQALEKYFTSADPGERYAQLKLIPQESRGMGMLQSIEPWLRDVQLLLDTIDHHALPEQAARLLPHMNKEQLAMTGMSWGGSMAGTVCLLDRRCKAAVNLDGMAWDWRLIDTELPVPLLLVQSDLRRMFPGYQGPPIGRADFMYEKVASAGDRSDIVRVMMDGTTHPDMTDLTLFARQPIRTRTVRLGTTPGDQVAMAVNSLVFDFLETNLRGRNLGFPDQTLRPWPFVKRHDISYVKHWYYTQGPGATAE